MAGGTVFNGLDEAFELVGVLGAVRLGGVLTLVFVNRFPNSLGGRIGHARSLVRGDRPIVDPAREIRLRGVRDIARPSLLAVVPQPEKGGPSWVRPFLRGDQRSELGDAKAVLGYRLRITNSRMPPACPAHGLENAELEGESSGRGGLVVLGSPGMVTGHVVPLSSVGQPDGVRHAIQFTASTVGEMGVGAHPIHDFTCPSLGMPPTPQDDWPSKQQCPERVDVEVGVM